MNPKLIKNHFEKSMEKYDQNAVVQKILAEKLCLELTNIRKEFPSILELGSGTGLLTKELTANIKYNKYTANDIVPKSKEYLSKIIKNFTFIGGNAQKIKPNGTFDLIASNAMFQWFENLEKVTDYYKNYLNKEGILAFTTFSPENFKEIRELTGLALEYKPLDELTLILSKQYKILYAEEFEHKITFKNALELLAHMKNTGVNSLTAQKWTFKEVKDFCGRYSEKYPDISLTYAPIIVIAQKNT